MQIFDVTGRFVNEINIVNERTIVDCQSWSKGVYVYRIVNSDGVPATGRFVIQ